MIRDILKIFTRNSIVNDHGIRVIPEGKWWETAKDIIDECEDLPDLDFKVFLGYEMKNSLLRFDLPPILRSLVKRNIRNKTIRKFNNYKDLNRTV